MYKLLGTDAGNHDKETDRLQDATLIKNDKGTHQTLDMLEGEYRLPLVWIDLEMTGRYQLFSFEFFNVHN